MLLPCESYLKLEVDKLVGGVYPEKNDEKEE